MYFFDSFSNHNEQIATIWNNEKLSYIALEQKCKNLHHKLLKHIKSDSFPDKYICFVFARNDTDTVITYLTLLRARQCVLFINPAIDQQDLEQLKQAFKPKFIFGESEESSFSLLECAQPEKVENEDVALLLSTSGSSGSAKYVALSYRNLDENARSIADFLPIEAKDRALCNLPLFYSYGLSVVNSHLFRGACCVLSDLSPMTKSYWSLLEDKNITSIAGVPFTYQMLLKAGLLQKHLPSLKYFTQAGGKLSDSALDMLYQYSIDNGITCYIMYGQTEATARIAYLAPSLLPEKMGAIGKAIPNGRLWLINDTNDIISASNLAGELVYSGPNVMLGYVNCSEDFCKLNKESGQDRTLFTGDIAYQDDSGVYFIVGRKSRFVKIFGVRIDLDLLEQVFSTEMYSVFCTGDDHFIYAVCDNRERFDDVQRLIANQANVHKRYVKVAFRDVPPINANGKIDYPSIVSMFT